MGLVYAFLSACANSREDVRLRLSVESDAFVVSLKNESPVPVWIHGLEYRKHVELNIFSLRGSEEPWIRQFADTFDGGLEYEMLGPNAEKSTRIPFRLVEQFVGLGSGCYTVVAKYYYTAPLESDQQNWALDSAPVEACYLWVTKHPTR